MTSPLTVLRQVVVWPFERALPATGRHRATALSSPLLVPLDDLLGPRPQPSPEPTYGAVVVQAWDDCGPCGKATAGVLHKDGWTCGECLITTPAGGVS